MPRSDARARVPPPNRLLAALPPREYGRLRPHLEPVPLVGRDVLHQPHQPIRHVHFPTRGAVSVLTPLADGKDIEVGLVGPEGVLGLPVVLGAGSSVSRCVVQVPGEALRLGAADFHRHVPRHGRLHALLLRYAHAFLVQVSQSVACNARHSVGRRLCRWLLMAHRRAGSDRFQLTHEFLAAILGVRRASVTEVAQRLQRAGLIRYARGQVAVLDRAGLEAAACECYHVVQRELDRVLA
jgi:CRP-like cAMP-binding protein